MQSATEIFDEMQEVELGDKVTWNGRKRAQLVISVSENTFDVEGNRGGNCRFFSTGTDAPFLTNLNSDRDYDVDEFLIVR